MSAIPNKLAILKELKIGHRIAEEEAEELEGYFVETNQWNEIFSGDIDVVFGSKGSGKSALYALLRRRAPELRARNILICPAENPTGTTVFSNLTTAPPPSEIAFVALWKLYCLTLCAKILRDEKIDNDKAKSLIAALLEAKLLSPSSNLESLFQAAKNRINEWFNKTTKSVEHSISIDSMTGLPIVARKTEFSDAPPDQRMELLPLDSLLQVANDALSSSGKSLWLLFDRLDVAFSEQDQLEKNALRALFRVYNDLKKFDRIKAKIFVRDDIWRRITEAGFPEASHIVRVATLSWNDGALLNLVVRRLIKSAALQEFSGLTEAEVKVSADKQRALIKKILPDKVDSGRNPETFEWMTTRVADGSGKSTPRELIHLIEEAKKTQISRLELGEQGPSSDQLFERSVFKEALKTVSQTRYEQTLLAEYPKVRTWTEALRGKKAEQTAITLAALWECERDAATDRANQLVSLGFFQKRSASGGPTFWVPFIYRDALELIQGRAS